MARRVGAGLSSADLSIHPEGHEATDHPLSLTKEGWLSDLSRDRVGAFGISTRPRPDNSVTAKIWLGNLLVALAFGGLLAAEHR